MTVPHSVDHADIMEPAVRRKFGKLRPRGTAHASSRAKAQDRSMDQTALRLADVARCYSGRNSLWPAGLRGICPHASASPTGRLCIRPLGFTWMGSWIPQGAVSWATTRKIATVAIERTTRVACTGRLPSPRPRMCHALGSTTLSAPMVIATAGFIGARTLRTARLRRYINVANRL